MSGPLQRLEGRLRGLERFAHLAPALAALFDVREDVALAQLARLDERDAWERGPGGRVWLMPALTGRKRGGALAVFLKIEPDGRLTHVHLGDEETLVLQGGYCDERGDEVWRGETQHRAEGSRHALTALPGLDCLLAVVTREPRGR